MSQSLNQEDEFDEESNLEVYVKEYEDEIIDDESIDNESIDNESIDNEIIDNESIDDESIDDESREVGWTDEDEAKYYNNISNSHSEILNTIEEEEKEEDEEELILEEVKEEVLIPEVVKEENTSIKRSVSLYTLICDIFNNFVQPFSK